jgi:hypothetical protein
MSTPCTAKKITRSACARQHRESVTVMPRRPEPLSAKDKQEIAVRRAKARAWARRLLKEHEEDAVLIAAAKSDPDNPPLRNDQLRRLRRTHEVRQELVARQLRREQGRPRSEKTKRQVTLRPAHS